MPQTLPQIIMALFFTVGAIGGCWFLADRIRFHIDLRRTRRRRDAWKKASHHE